MTVPVSIMWFRQDLRVKDNPALNAACDMGKIVPIYIYDDTAPNGREPGGASKWWLHHSLSSLNKRLNGHLQIFKGDPQTLIPNLMKSFNAKGIFWNRCYEPWQINRDKTIKKTLIEHDYEAHSCNGSLLWEPMKVLKKDGTPYRVFTPYYKKGCLQVEEPRYPKAPPARITYADVDNDSDGLTSLDLLPSINWDATHCQLALLLARSASNNVSQNHRSPSCQLSNRFFTKNEPTIMRTRLCMYPVCHSSRMPASTIGMPVFPFCHALSAFASVRQGNLSNFSLKFLLGKVGKWNSK